jgi:hypothetical protein
MPIYVYETIPQSEVEKPRRFEVKQSMKDAPLTRHPDTGDAVRRVISGGSHGNEHGCQWNCVVRRQLRHRLRLSLIVFR